MDATAAHQGRSVRLRSVTISSIVLIALVLGMNAWSASQRAEAANTFTLRMTDFSFSPSHMVWRVGDTVTVKLSNESQAHPGTPHEWMVGRTPNTEETAFGPQTIDGFAETFFDGVDINVVDGSNVTMLMPGLAKLSGKNPMSLMPRDKNGRMIMDMNMEAGGTGFMPVMAPTGSLTISFIVPDKPGQWQYGCFQQSGQHFSNGMNGTITVTKG